MYFDSIIPYVVSPDEILLKVSSPILFAEILLIVLTLILPTVVFALGSDKSVALGAIISPFFSNCEQPVNASPIELHLGKLILPIDFRFLQLCHKDTNKISNRHTFAHK